MGFHGLFTNFFGNLVKIVTLYEIVLSLHSVKKKCALILTHFDSVPWFLKMPFDCEHELTFDCNRKVNDSNYNKLKHLLR